VTDKRGGNTMQQVEGYWKAQLTCLIIISVPAMAAFLNSRSSGNSKEANEASGVIAYIDKLGIAS